MNQLHWEPLFEVTALILTIIFFLFYKNQRILPTRKNLQFPRLFTFELTCIFFSLISSYLTTHPEQFPLWLLQITNNLYFISLVTVFYAFYAYCRYFAEESTKSYQTNWWPLRIPYFLIIVVLAINPFTNWVFRVTNENGYVRSFLYIPCLICFQLFYTLVGLYFVFKNRKSISKKYKHNIYWATTVIFIGIIFQGWILPTWLVINVFLSVGFAILCLSMQNPKYLTDYKTKLFDIYVLKKFADEIICRNKPYHFIAFTFENYKTKISVYGTENINKVLTYVGSILFKKSKKNPSFYIHNGKFVIYLNEKDSEEQIKNHLLSEFRRPIQIGNLTLNEIKIRLVSLSTNKSITSGDEIISILNDALDYSENINSNILKIDMPLIERTKANEKIRMLLNKAIKDDSLIVFYQPIFDSKANQVTSAEALVRIYDSEIGLIAPSSFISVAEEDETILVLGMQVLKKVCEFIKNHDMKKLGLKYIEVNLSPIQCMHNELADEIIHLTNEYGVDLSYLNFEITESSMFNLDDVKNMMTKLIDAGASFSLDDYGTGFSNLINVLKLPLKIIKIDKSIVDGYFISNQEVLPKIVNMFHEEGFDVLAEGVETEPQKDGISNMNCRYIQGFYYSKPLPQEQFIEYLKNINDSVV